MRALPLVSLVVSLLVSRPVAAAGPAAAPSLDNIRPRDAAGELLLRFGAQRSPTFRGIVRELEHSHVIVYVEVRQDAAHPVGGALHFIGAAGGVRWVRARVDSGTANRARAFEDIVRLTAILGHELRHALEADAAPSLDTLADFERYYRRIGVDDRHLLDTLAARATGATVESERRGATVVRAD
jgi:hypothetical protein